MSDEQEIPTVPEPEAVIPPLVETEESTDAGKKKSPKWIAASDLNEIIAILVKADGITAQQAVDRLNNMVRKGSLVIVPLLGTKRNP